MRSLAYPILLVFLLSGCKDYLKEWREGQEAERRESEEKLRPDYIPPECRHPYGLYRVFSFVAWDKPACYRLEGYFKHDAVVWWGGTDRFGPDHKASRVRKRGCEYEYTEDNFVGTESREMSNPSGTKKAKPMITYRGTWTYPVPAWQTTYVGDGYERFIKEGD